MSNVETAPAETACGAQEVPDAPTHELLEGREVVLGGSRGMVVSRTLPHRDRRMVGAWCFVDYYGPADTAGSGMRVPPHPHTGLQTVSWLVEGEVLHRDSLGSHALIQPGQLNLMTAGHGIAHSEESPADHSPTLHGVQLWVALPDAHRAVEPGFTHHADLPILARPGLAASVIMGELDGTASPARTYSPLVAVQAAADGGIASRLPLRRDFEYAVLTLSGSIEVDGFTLDPGPMLYLGRGRTKLTVRADQPSRLLLLGGEPFEEQIVMWWNFVGRSHDDIATAREQWMAGERFGTVVGYDGPPLPAPALPATTLKPRGRHR